MRCVSGGGCRGTADGNADGKRVQSSSDGQRCVCRASFVVESGASSSPLLQTMTCFLQLSPCALGARRCRYGVNSSREEARESEVGGGAYLRSDGYRAERDGVTVMQTSIRCVLFDECVLERMYCRYF